MRHGQPHYGFKAHVAVDEEHTLIRRAELGPASEHDSRRFEDVVAGDEQMVVADKTYWSRERGAWLDERNIGNGINHDSRFRHLPQRTDDGATTFGTFPK